MADQFSAASFALRANQYCVLGLRLLIAKFPCGVPATFGIGSPVACVAEAKFPDVMVEVEYRRSYNTH